MSLDPSTNRRKKEEEEARQRRSIRLNPPFPYKLLPFDIEAFGVDEDPPKVPVQTSGQ